MIKKTWFNPAMIYTLIWSFFVIFPCFFWNSMYWNYNGLLWIVISCFSLIIGQAFALFFYKNRNHSYNNNDLCVTKPFSRLLVSLNTFRIVIFILLILSMVYIAYSIIKKGFNLSVFFNADELLLINNYIAYNRYNTEESVGILNQINLIIQYSLPLFGGILINFSDDRKDKILAIITLLPVTASLAISNAKAGFIASVFNFIISYMLSYYLVHMKYKKFKVKTILIIFAIFCLFIGILFISMCLRTGNFDDSSINYVKQRIMVYSFGQMKAFDEWYVSRGNSSYGFGSSTYMWIFNRLGLVTRNQGVYGYASSIRTNVYTMFRGVITDFGIYGGQIYFFIRGIIGGYINEIFEKKKNISPTLYALYSSNYLFIFFGLFISPWTYTTFSLIFILFVLVIHFSNLVKFSLGGIK